MRKLPQQNWLFLYEKADDLVQFYWALIMYIVFQNNHALLGPYQKIITNCFNYNSMIHKVSKKGDRFKMLIPCAIYLITSNSMGQIMSHIYCKQLPMPIAHTPHCIVPRHCIQKQFTSYHIHSKFLRLAEHQLLLHIFHTSYNLCYKLHQPLSSSH